MDTTYIIALLFVALLVFVYFENRQYIGIIKHLTSILAHLKGFTLGAPEPGEKVVSFAEIQEKIDEDFGAIEDDKEPEEEGGEEE